MSKDLNSTPSANRTHIGFFGKRNSGKSSLMNALTNQSVSIVSEIPGTTTDPVSKAMEIKGIGSCVLIDTAGFDDIGELGKLRIEKTKKVIDKIDMAILLFDDLDISSELMWYELFQSKKISTLLVVSKGDIRHNIYELKNKIEASVKVTPFISNITDKENIASLQENIINLAQDNKSSDTILNNLVSKGEVVLLVMPQDIQAPQGRLILPQVQTIRELLDKDSVVISVTTNEYTNSLKLLIKPPKLIITDSQAFSFVYENKPKESLLTSFSVLFAAYKGDIGYFMESVKAMDKLLPTSHVLIAEACTHVPLTEDIGREKIPKMLRKKIGKELSIDVVSGNDFPDDLIKYDLIIHCGACMFNRKLVLSKVDKAKSQNIPMTNYGVFIAYVSNILDKIVF